MTKLPYLTGLAAIVTLLLAAPQVYASVYGAGTYGACQYSSCSISLSSSSSVAASVTPVGTSVTCTVRNDDVAVTTASSTGYTVTLNNTDTSSEMTGSGSEVIPPVSATVASPTALSANTWGYRVDDTASFGSGPTSVITNASIPALTFAAVPTSSEAPGPIVTSNVAAPTPVTTEVWYGVCADIHLPSDTYSDEVTYTAVIN